VILPSLCARFSLVTLFVRGRLWVPPNSQISWMSDFSRTSLFPPTPWFHDPPQGAKITASGHCSLERPLFTVLVAFPLLFFFPVSPVLFLPSLLAGPDPTATAGTLYKIRVFCTLPFPRKSRPFNPSTYRRPGSVGISLSPPRH